MSKMFTVGSEALDAEAIRAVARNCGELSVGCSDAAGYVARVSEGMEGQLAALSDLEGVTHALEADQSAVATAINEARRLSDRARGTLRRETTLIAASMTEFEELTGLIGRLGTRMTDFAAAMEQVQRVSAAIDAIARKTNLLALNATIEAQRAGDAGRTFAVVAAEVKKLALETRQATDEITQTMESFVREAGSVITEIDDGVRKSQSAQKGVSQINQTVLEVEEIVREVEGITDGIERSTDVTSDGVVRMRETLTGFAAQAREGSGTLNSARDRMLRLEAISNNMLNRLAHSGVDIDDMRFIEAARAGMVEVRALVEAALRDGRLARSDVFDADYVPVPGSDPLQYTNRFNHFADAHIRPILDRIARTDPERVRGVACTDMNGYLPTHVTWRSMPQRPGEPAWNGENCRNRRMFMDDSTARALRYDGDFMLFTYRQDLGQAGYRAVKSVFVPMHFDGQRWGNFELAFVD